VRSRANRSTGFILIALKFAHVNSLGMQAPTGGGSLTTLIQKDPMARTNVIISFKSEGLAT
jgi:hypothetical protein